MSPKNRFCRTAVGQLTRDYEVRGHHLGTDSYHIVPALPEQNAPSSRAHDHLAPSIQMPPLETEVEDADLAARLIARITSLSSR